MGYKPVTYKPRDPKRIDKIMTLINSLWHQNPDLRLTQLIINVVGPTKTDLYYIDDDELTEKLAAQWNKSE